ncbi:MAG: hypothetical protein ABIP19_04665 [Dermatophilaceae bacterium]
MSISVPLAVIVVSSLMARVVGVSMHVRVATSDDAQTIAEIHVALWQECSDADPNLNPPSSVRRHRPTAHLRTKENSKHG